MVSSALKHAFPDDAEGEIIIILRISAPGEVELTVKDNGVGLPANFEIMKDGSLGLQLVDMLAQEQLKGEIILKLDKGTEFIVRFRGVGNGKENCCS